MRSSRKVEDKKIGHDGEVHGICSPCKALSPGRYANNPYEIHNSRSTQKAGYERYKKAVKCDPLSIAGCFNCTEKHHVVKNCPKPLKIATAAANKQEYHAKKNGIGANGTHIVLAKFCFYLNTVNAGSNPVENITESHDKELFERAFSKLTNS